MPRDLEPARTKTQQPDLTDTKKSQKRYRMPEEYKAEAVNSELDQVHRRINEVIVEAEASPDLDAATATAAQCAADINNIKAILRRAGLLRS